ncbi:uncharacterized protein LOC103723761 isoform X1 [Phoenix dactylifera]|uniref:Uncharacterized protein LOC103723761 isoform X1 n=1 Tax=Phoenix dactylifera TaxID=42345 RepID=A0A8B7D4P2_PHODC|nr:uncharacterized protein LOC103723761 isoform X1 [Phoenix dactylifera]XP_008813003.2 uncharacterized protein LOC103723761 isoform X1 [Phoenix dactylifera]
MAAIWTSARPPPFFSHDVRRLSRSSLSLYVYISLPSSPSLGFRRAHLEGIRSLRCFSRPRGGSGAPPLLKIAVGGVTELLRLFSPDKRRDESRIGREVSLARGVDDVVQILKSDYDRAYFLTGNFNSDIYAEDCLFEDPTIKFRGKAQYSQNLELLVPFFDHPSLKLEKIEKGSHDEVDFILATWKLRTYLKFPWRPLIGIKGTTTYDLDENFNIVRHAESWNVSALEAIGQIFKLGSKDGDE